MNQIKLDIENDILQLKNTVNTSNSYADLCRYYGLPNNGKQHRYFKDLLDKNNISITHWNWHKQFFKYNRIEKCCPVCKSKFTALEGNKREQVTCSYKCSNVFFFEKRNTETSRENKSNAVKNYLRSIGKNPLTKIKTINGSREVIPLLKINCANCGNEKFVRNKTQKCCSKKCASELRSRNPDYIQKLQAAQRRLIAEGRHSGWKSRNILSYPEKFFINVLKNNGIEFVSNKPVLSYFLDFALEDKKIDLEIDGKQHKYPDRKESDILRDKTLSENGWKIYRIDWNEINSDAGKQRMKDKIEKFLDVYKSA